MTACMIPSCVPPHVLMVYDSYMREYANLLEWSKQNGFPSPHRRRIPPCGESTAGRLVDMWRRHRSPRQIIYQSRSESCVRSISRLGLSLATERITRIGVTAVGGD